ncbi:hypothetical protein LAZ67_15002307 [Cordylochernes scorpioides]|uniref:DDE-1 domain-containing protein n=1 Tax=Cordylochernes scorpioides TaxID=51811 RepID=A0ABY6LAP7_9ARAC|nr:hypothetical protein LAZ67_15002307 [Cordylochernes scorpioides]
MEKLLMLWVTEKQLQGDTLTQTIFCEKARAIYGDLLKQTRRLPSTRHRKSHLKPAGAGLRILKRGAVFTPLAVLEKRCRMNIYNGRGEDDARPQTMKDRLTLALCQCEWRLQDQASARVPFGKPQSIYSHKILKEKLQVMWRSNPKAWVTRKFFVEWVNLVFGPIVKKYLQENNLPVQALLILENAPAHPPNLEDDILEELKFIKVLYLPPNTTPILQPMDQQVTNSENMKPRFQQASQKGQKNVVISLIRQGIDVNSTFWIGVTALHECSKFGHVDTARILIEAGAEVNRRNLMSLTPLDLAILGEHVEMVKLLLESGAQVNRTDRRGSTPLYLSCCTAQNEEIAKILIKAGADINARTDLYSRTCLHHSGKINIADILLRNGASINIQDSLGYTPLNAAVQMGNLEMVMFLLSKGADPNIMDYDDGFPLHIAIAFGNRKAVELLIFNGADIFKKVDRIGCLDQAVAFHHIDIAKLLIMHMVVKKPTFLKPEIVANEPTLLKYWEDCQAETEYMDKTVIGKSTITYRKFVLESSENKLALNLSHKTTRVKETLSNTEVLNKKLKIYSLLIGKKVSLGEKRKALLDKMKTFVKATKLKHLSFTTKAEVIQCLENYLIENNK